MIKLVYALLYHNASVYETHRSKIIELFEILIHWFFEYSHHNIYHHLFYQLISLIIGDKDERIINSILVENNLINRMIEVYIDKKGDYDNKGHILDIFNLLRLTSKCLDPKSSFNQHLTSNELWSSFQSLLITDTLIETHGLTLSDIDIGSECKFSFLFKN